MLPLGRADLEAPIWTRFLRVVAACPDRIALIDAQGRMDYATLAQRAATLAAHLAQALPPGAPVLLLLPTTRSVVVAMLAALCCGRPYIPLDASFPSEHLRRVLVHSGAKLLLSDPAMGRKLLGGEPSLPALLDPDSLSAGPQHAVTARPEDAANVLYTSGSTGAPKGVWQDQRGLLHDVMQYTQAIGLSPADRLSLLYSPAVGGATRDIFGALLNGATLCMFDLRRDGLRQVLDDLDRLAVTVLHAMPPVLRSLIRTRAGTICPSARVVYTAGDRFLAQDLAEVRRHLPAGCAVYTGIGSTECSTLYRDWIIPPDWQADGATVPVGRALPDREMRIVSDTGEVLAPGETGQIEVSSPFIARGYWNDPALTEAAFVPVADRPGWRRFRPGDLGRLRADGLLEFLGRADRQIKIRGYRFDPAEVEATLRSLPEVTDAVVLAEEREGRSDVLAFVETRPGRWSAEGLRDALQSQLPAHLVPRRIVPLAEMPRLGNFKCDIAALRRIPEPEERGTPVPCDIPADYLQIWAGVLKRPVTLEDRLDRIGADSLALMEVELAVAQRLGRQLRAGPARDETLAQLWHGAAPVAVPDRDSPASAGLTAGHEILPRLAGLMSASTGRAVNPDGTLRAYHEAGTRMPLIWCFNQIAEAEALALALGPDQPLFALRSLNGIVAPQPPDALRERVVTENALQALAMLGPFDMVTVGGNCQAARIALNLANGLWTSGVQVASLVFMERAHPIPYAGRHLVLFGANSLTHNPRFRFAAPLAAAPVYTPRRRSAEIPGAHGQYFRPENVTRLAATLRQEMDQALHDLTAPICPAGRRVAFATEWTWQAGAVCELKLQITNPGPSAWAMGAQSGLAVTIHLLTPQEETRPLRPPDLTVPLPFDLLPGETGVMQIALGQAHAGPPRLHLGLCEEGYHWFADISGPQSDHVRRAGADHWQR